VSQIVLKIPTTGTKFIEGESELTGFEDMILCNQVSYDISVETEMNYESGRTIHMPTLSAITIERDVDIATAELTRFALAHRVSETPWEIYFLKSANEGLSNAGGRPLLGYTIASLLGTSRHIVYMTLKLHLPLITKQDISMEEEGMRETLEINVGGVEWSYTVTDIDQRKLGHVGFKFNMQTGTVG